MAWTLDHVFVLGSEGAPEADRLRQSGLHEAAPNTHRGQGTANRRFFFHNAMLEFLWIVDEAETNRAPVSRIGFESRVLWRISGASPFGVGLRPAEGPANAPLPFSTWAYQPSYLPEGRAIRVAESSEHPAEPFLFGVPWAQPPSSYPPARRPPMDHANGVRRIARVEITTPVPEASWSASLRAVAALDHLQIRVGSRHRMVVEVDALMHVDLTASHALFIRHFG